MRSKMRYPVSDPVLCRCIAIALVQKKFIRSSLKATLWEAGLYADLHQELVSAAVEAWRQGYDPDTDFRAIRNTVQRRIYGFLKDNGFHRHWDPISKKQGKGFFRREIPLPEKKHSLSYEFGDNTALIAWCEAYITQALGREAWEEVIRWSNSRAPEPQGIAAKSISILKEAFSR